MVKLTRIYLVSNCYGDSNKVYVGKEKSPQSGNRKSKHKKTFGIECKFEFIDEIDGWDKQRYIPLECFWIQHFKNMGFEVLNKNNGGGGPSFYTEEQKLKMRKPHPTAGEKLSKILKGKIRSEESLINMRIPHKEGTGEKISKANLGKKKHNDESKSKISQANKGKNKPPGFGEKVSKSNKGNSCGPRGQKFSQETRSKMSISNMGKKDTDETKLKKSISASKNPFICIETNQIFLNTRLASEKLKISTGGITSVLKNIKPHTHNYSFKYI